MANKRVLGCKFAGTRDFFCSCVRSLSNENVSLLYGQNIKGLERLFFKEVGLVLTNILFLSFWPLLSFDQHLDNANRWWIDICVGGCLSSGLNSRMRHYFYFQVIFLAEKLSPYLDPTRFLFDLVLRKVTKER